MGAASSQLAREASELERASRALVNSTEPVEPLVIRAWGHNVAEIARMREESGVIFFGMGFVDRMDRVVNEASVRGEDPRLEDIARAIATYDEVIQVHRLPSSPRSKPGRVWSGEPTKIIPRASRPEPSAGSSAAFRGRVVPAHLTRLFRPDKPKERNASRFASSRHLNTTTPATQRFDKARASYKAAPSILPEHVWSRNAAIFCNQGSSPPRPPAGPSNFLLTRLSEADRAKEFDASVLPAPPRPFSTAATTVGTDRLQLSDNTTPSITPECVLSSRTTVIIPGASPPGLPARWSVVAKEAVVLPPPMCLSGAARAKEQYTNVLPAPSRHSATTETTLGFDKPQGSRNVTPPVIALPFAPLPQEPPQPAIKIGPPRSAKRKRDNEEDSESERASTKAQTAGSVEGGSNASYVLVPRAHYRRTDTAVSPGKESNVSTPAGGEEDIDPPAGGLRGSMTLADASKALEELPGYKPRPQHRNLPGCELCQARGSLCYTTPGLIRRGVGVVMKNDGVSAKGKEKGKKVTDGIEEGTSTSHSRRASCDLCFVSGLQCTLSTGDVSEPEEAPQAKRQKIQVAGPSTPSSVSPSTPDVSGSVGPEVLAALVRCIQSLEAKIESLEAKVETLTNNRTTQDEHVNRTLARLETSIGTLQADVKTKHAERIKKEED